MEFTLVVAVADGNYMYSGIFNNEDKQKEFVESLEKMGYVPGPNNRASEIYNISKIKLNDIPKEHIEEWEEFQNDLNP